MDEFLSQSLKTLIKLNININTSGEPNMSSGHDKTHHYSLIPLHYFCLFLIKIIFKVSISSIRVPARGHVRSHVG